MRRLDLLETAIKASPDASAILKYSLQVCQRLVIQRSFRQEVKPCLICLCSCTALQPEWPIDLHSGLFCRQQLRFSPTWTQQYPTVQ